MMHGIKRLHSNLFFVSDLKRTSEFYKKLGFDVQDSDDAVRIKIGDFTLCFMDEAKVQIDKESFISPKGIGIFNYIDVDDVDEHYGFVKSNGINPSSEPKTYPWGKREFAVKDLDGYKMVFYSNVKI